MTDTVSWSKRSKPRCSATTARWLGYSAQPVIFPIASSTKHYMSSYAQSRRSITELPRKAEELDEAEFPAVRGLELAEDLTGSNISFLHFVNEDEQTIELVAWSRRTIEHYCNVVHETHYPVRDAGIWADALRRREPVVFNDYAAYPDKHGLPAGHAELLRLISVPVIESGKVVMLVGVGNSSIDYTELDVETVQLVANEIRGIVHRQRFVDMLSAKEARYRELVDNMSAGVAVYEAVDDGRDFIFRDHNAAGLRINDMTREQIIGRGSPRCFRASSKWGCSTYFTGSGKQASRNRTLHANIRTSDWHCGWIISCSNCRPVNWSRCTTTSPNVNVRKRRSVKANRACAR